MPSDFAFRLSTYLTLALSCLCIGYSEYDLLPEAGVLAGAVLVLLAVSFWTGRRHELDLQSANRVGLVIGLLAVGWLAYQFVNKKSLIYTLPWPSSLLPYLGPLLMVLMPAKLFRPKHVGDWWAMHGIALAGVGLAASMAEDEVFGVLLGLYAVSAVTSLALFFYRRSAGALPALPNTDPGPVPQVVAAGPGRTRAVTWRAVGWLALAVGVGLPLFFVTPRSQAPKWQYGKTREVGLTTEQMVDLTRTGDLRESGEEAYRVRATHADGTPKDDLSLNQRWRAFTFNVYESGRWSRSDGGALIADGARIGKTVTVDERSFVPPDLGPHTYSLDFLPRQPLADPVLADPVAWDVGKTVPVCTIDGSRVQMWFQLIDGTFRPLGLAARAPQAYRQYTRPVPSAAVPAEGADPDLGAPFELTDPLAKALADPANPINAARSVRLSKLKFWTRDLLDRLAATDPPLRAALQRGHTRRDLEIAPDDYEVVARALSAHLAGSGEYKYTSKLRRADPEMDPVEEFLTRSREGHCQRFAAGLALMLRSVGIPANYVLGFKGCEPEGDGTYLIRQDHAHAWVEVLVIRPAPPGYPLHHSPAPGQAARVCHWLSLDPSPGGGGDEPDGGVGGWLGAAREGGAAFFQNFIIGYNKDRRAWAVASARDWLIRGGWAVVAILAAVAAVLIARPDLLRRAGRSRFGGWTTGYDWFDRLTTALAAGGYPAPPGATPREHAAATSAALAARPETASVADVPLTVTRAFYLARYAGEPPSPAEVTGIRDDLDRLQAALRSAPREASP